jgi:ABC-2 type transport system permease protein
MNGALFEILWRSWRGALVQRARRLKRPRYLVAFVLSAAYFGFLVMPSLLGVGRRQGGLAGGGGGAAASLGADTAQLVLLLASLALAVVATAIWVFAPAKPSLQLSEADIHLLLPAPLPRRKVIELTLWRQQAGLLFGALVVTLVRGYGSPAVRLQRLITAWTLFTLLSLGSKGASLWKARLRELPRAAAAWRIAAAVAIAGAFWTAVGLAIGAVLRQAAAGPGAPGAPPWLATPPTEAAVRGLLHRVATSRQPALTVLLAPFRWLAGGVLASRVQGRGGLPGLALPGLSGAAWAATALFMAALLAATYEWVVRSRARFEDAAVENARRRVERRVRRPALPQRTARVRRLEPFALAPTGRPEVAIYWKNLLIPGRTPLARRALQVLLPGAAVAAVGTALGAPPPLLATVGGCGLLIMLLMPLLAGVGLRHDLRMDLLQVEVLRPWPVPGWRLVAAELLAPATTAWSFTLAGFGLFLGAAIAARDHLAATALPGLDGALRAAAGAAPAGGAAAAAGTGGMGVLGVLLALGTALLIAGVPVTLLSSAVQNLAALMLPGWVTLGPDRRSGSGLAGMRLLLLLGQLVALLLGLLPAALVVGAALLLEFLLGIKPGLGQAPVLAILGSLPVLAVVGLLVRAGGACWDRLDPSQEMLNPDA